MKREGPCRFLSRRGFATARIPMPREARGVSGLGQHGATNVAETVDALTRLIQSLRPSP